MRDEIIAIGIMDKDSELLWNRAHNSFCPLSQNTLFLKNIGQYNRMVNETTCGHIKHNAFIGKSLAPVEIHISVAIDKSPQNDQKLEGLKKLGDSDNKLSQDQLAEDKEI